ncbi:MAG: hypothetical protein ABEK59_00550 [Halobacteria archaeon]
MAKYGDIQRYEPPKASAAGSAAILVLTIVEFALIAILVIGISTRDVTNTASNMFYGMILGYIFLDLAFILLIYKVEFLPDMLVIKKRRKKYEDIWVTEEGVDGESLRDTMQDKFQTQMKPYKRRD